LFRASNIIEVICMTRIALPLVSSGREFRELRRVSVDRHWLPASGRAWCAGMRSLASRLELEGHTVELVEVDPAQLLAFCVENGLPVDAGARLRFARHVAGIEEEITA
jgi:hypothetical protein